LLGDRSHRRECTGGWTSTQGALRLDLDVDVDLVVDLDLDLDFDLVVPVAVPNRK